MRDSLLKLIKKTVVAVYSLPYNDGEIDKTLYTEESDFCYKCLSDEDLSEIIYNSIVEYSFSKNELTYDYNKLHSRALILRLKYNAEASETTRLKYGFYGEVLLHVFLQVFFQSTTYISRGHFYNPLENSETKGYDCFHLLENDGKLELWFGETKFRISFKDSLEEIIDHIPKAMSPEYLNRNLYAIFDKYDHIEDQNNKLDKIQKKWMNDTEINLMKELQNEDITLVYPCLVIGDYINTNFDQHIRECIKIIENKFKPIETDLKIKLFFIFMPVNSSKDIKKAVLRCIEEKKQLI